MRRVILAVGLVLSAISGEARAADPVPPSGLAVVALPGAADAAWPLAQAVYAEPSLRPSSVDDAHARALCGEAATADAPADLRDVADTVAALHGDDAPTRTLLGGLAHRFGVKALIVVHVDSAHAPSAAVFLADTNAFDAAVYAPDAATASASAGASAGASASAPRWSGATASLLRAFGQPAPAPPPPPQVAAPALATHEAKAPGSATPSRAFYESGWFWGALGVAALAGGAVFFATRDTPSPTIHLQAQVPSQ